MTAPEILWELFLGIYCTIWGFRRDAPILRGAPGRELPSREVNRFGRARRSSARQAAAGSAEGGVGRPR